jgi:hypothetical protein
VGFSTALDLYYRVVHRRHTCIVYTYFFTYVCISLCESSHASVNSCLPHCQSSLPVCLYGCQPPIVIACLSVCMAVCLTVRVACLSVCLSVWLPTSHRDCLPACAAVCYCTERAVRWDLLSVTACYRKGGAMGPPLCGCMEDSALYRSSRASISVTRRRDFRYCTL